MTTSLYPTLPVLVVDDEPAVLDGFEIALNSGGYTNVVTLSDSRKVLPFLATQQVELVFLDLMMPHVGGLELLRRIKRIHPGLPVIVATAVSEIDSVVQCIRNGATDYMLKPVEAETLLNQVRKYLELQELERENARLRESLLSERLRHPEAFQEIITQDPQLLSIFRYCEAVAVSSKPVLITGETGTGKEQIAGAIHELSGREGEFVAVNVAAFDDNMFSDALFGHVKGAFTGADQPRKGLVAKAWGGTLFLDEIGDLSVPSQVKLLRLLQEKEYFPVGSDVPKRTNIRVVTSTLKDLTELKKEGKFREDLYFRCTTHHVHLPPLRKRDGDIPLLLDHFLSVEAKELGKKTPRYHPELLHLLEAYHFPGNVREFKAMVADAVAGHSGGMLSAAAFKRFISAGLQASGIGAGAGAFPVFHGNGDDKAPMPRLREAVEELTTKLVAKAMRRAGGNQSVAARFLGISQQALSQRLKKLDLSED